MDMREIITPDSVLAKLKINSKKQLLQALSELAATQIHRDEHEILNTLIERERLGSTGIGHGVAIPHGKLNGLSRIMGVFIQLAKPVEFESLDHSPVDLAFMLLAPEDAGADHLKILSRSARFLKKETVLSSLRLSLDAQTIYNILVTIEYENIS
ncbi:PTS IIA-like nitrogen regulatory protein PtsN [Candidatus Endowatersipora endosymbiont of Watersipora subatra]|uniref:PTS IIA-like nitrogen regulatory protein PtsN n=1 Tax=Candidatus Endowatersipora endosymbiont of Watersipora subatra TaxID=3077946 RepID=UPI00312C99B9